MECAGSGLIKWKTDNTTLSEQIQNPNFNCQYNTLSNHTKLNWKKLRPKQEHVIFCCINTGDTSVQNIYSLLIFPFRYQLELSFFLDKYIDLSAEYRKEHFGMIHIRFTYK